MVWRRALILAILAVAGCSDQGDPIKSGGGEPPDEKASFADEIQPIFDENCVSCHSGGSPPADLSLSEGSSYANLVGVVSSGYAPDSLVVPERPDASVLYLKMTATEGYGQPMPPLPLEPVHPDERALVRQWITEGAQDN